MSTNNQQPTRPISAPVVHHHGPSVAKVIAVGTASTIINGSVIGLMLFLSYALGFQVNVEVPENQAAMEQRTEVEETPKEYDLTNTDLGLDDSVPLNYNVDRIEDVSVPGKVDPTQNVGVENAPVAAPTNVPAPAGTGGGTGGAPFDPNVSGTGSAFGTPGGMGGIGTAGGFAGRSGSTRVKMLTEGGGNKFSEKAVADGLRWLVLHQAPDGHWSLHEFNKYARTEPIPNGKIIPDNATPLTTRNNDIAGTAFGLLPMLAAGITHKPPVKWKGYIKKDYSVAGHNISSGTEVEVLAEVGSDYKVRIKLPKGSQPETTDVQLTTDQVMVTPNYNRSVNAGVKFLIAKQTKTGEDRGYFGVDMYSHGLATIAMCEAYGLTSDPVLKTSAQLALDYIVRAQHDAGGWRYSKRQAGDTSVVGWQLMALKSGQMSGLSVPKITLKKVEKYLDSVQPPNEYKEPAGTYGYTDYRGGSPAMTAVGALCRQYLGVNPRNPSLLKSVDYLKKIPPGKNNLYYEYYATQVMHHMGGSAWAFWNEGKDEAGKQVHPGIRDSLIAKQVKAGANAGSWAGDDHVGGRLGATSLSLLTLEVYYRHLPLYGRIDISKPEEDK